MTAGLTGTQFGIRWPTGSVFAYNSRQDAEWALAEDGRGVAELVVHEYEPGTSNATEWRQADTPEGDR